MSPISSRNRVPPLASSKRPLRSEIAPVKDPLRWPNSSLSSKSLGMAPQFTGINGPRARSEQLCSALATSSLPVPLSPKISAVESLGPTISINARSSLISLLDPTIDASLDKNQFTHQIHGWAKPFHPLIQRVINMGLSIDVKIAELYSYAAISCDNLYLSFKTTDRPALVRYISCLQK